jgi:hypothetical protein
MLTIVNALSHRTLRQIPAKTRRDGNLMLILSAHATKMHVLNQTALEIYCLCDGRSLKHLMSEIVKRYPQQDRTQLAWDVLLALRDLERSHLITFSRCKRG